MATYAVINNAEVQVNKPVTSSLMTRLRDNAIALIEQLGYDVSSGYYESAELAITAGANGTIPHGLTNVPIDVQAHLVCKSAEYGYAVGDRLFDAGFGLHLNNSPCGISIASNATNLLYAIGASSVSVNALNASSGAGVNLTLASWKLVIRARG